MASHLYCNWGNSRDRNRIGNELFTCTLTSLNNYPGVSYKMTSVTGWSQSAANAVRSVPVHNKLLIIRNLSKTKCWWHALICHVGLCLEDPAGGLKQTWKGMAALAPYHTFKPLRLLSPGPHKTAALCALKVRHIKKAFKGEPWRCLFQESLKKWNDEAFHGVLFTYLWFSTHCKMLQVADNKSCTPWMSTRQCSMPDNSIIRLLGDAQFSCVVAYAEGIIDLDYWQLF